jgi:hypothetical protein
VVVVVEEEEEEAVWREPRRGLVRRGLVRFSVAVIR